MGIRSLTSFIKSNNQYFVPHQLCNTYVIIDGGIYISIYDGLANDDPRFGGDCKKIYDTTMELFRRFKECGVTPIVIMGGMHEDREEEASQRKDAATFSDFVSYNYNGYMYFPHGKASSIFRASSFYEALDDLDVFRSRADFEANGEIVEIARKLNAPVISNDSDFFIFDGITFLHWDYIKITENKDLKYIECQRFNREKLVSDYKISPSILPFLKVMFGERNVYELAFPTKTRCRPTDKFRNALKWLRGDTVATAKEKIMNSAASRNLDATARRELETEIDTVIDNYTNLSTTLSSLLEQGFGFRCSFRVKEKTLGSCYNVPEDLEDVVRRCQFPVTILDMLTRKKYKCRTALEDLKLPSVYEPSLRLIQGIYSILVRNEIEKPPLKITMRQNMRMAVIEKDAKELPAGDLTEEQKKRILLEIMDLKEEVYDSVIKSFDGDWVLFLLSLIFFKKKCDNANDKHISSIILTAILLHVLKMKGKSESNKETGEDEDPFKNLDKDTCEKIARKADALEIKKSDNFRLTGISDIHWYLTFQSCLFFVKRLFQILDLQKIKPLKSFNIKCSWFIQGSFFYSLLKAMDGVTNFRDWMKEYFEENEQLCDFYQRIVNNCNL